MNFVAGQPSTGAPKAVREEAKRLLDEGPLGYTVATGIPEGLHTIRVELVRNDGEPLDPPIRAEATGRLKGIVHDQSASGATLFVEPPAAVEFGNRIRELEVVFVVGEATTPTGAALLRVLSSGAPPTRWRMIGAGAWGAGGRRRRGG